VVMRDFEKKNITVTSGLQKSVLGGDVLVIPTNAPHPERAIKLIELLVDTETQLALAKKLFWAPVHGDVYTALSEQPEMKEYFGVIHTALQSTLDTGVLRPMTPIWGLIAEVLSDALQDVLAQGRKKNAPATTKEIDDLLEKYVDRLQKIPTDVTTCIVVANQTTDTKDCTEVQYIVAGLTKPSIEALALSLATKPKYLAMLNDRGVGDPVSPKTMQILLIPKLKAGG